MNKILLIFFVTILSFPCKASWSVKNVPIEFVWLVDSIQASKSSERQTTNLDEKFNQLGNILQKISPDSISFLIKSEIYKGILETQWNNLLSYRLIDEKTPSLINEKIIVNSNKFSSFSRWTITALNSDISSLIASKEFKAKSSQAEKRIALLTPWATLILNTSADQFEAAIKPVMFTIIDRIIRTTTLFVEQVRQPIETQKNNPVTFFIKSLSNEEQVPSKALPFLPDKILESITIQNPLAPTGRDSALKNEILPNPNDRSVTAPRAINDWANPLQKTPKAGILPMPVPVNDWIIPLDPKFKPNNVPSPTNDPNWFYGH